VLPYREIAEELTNRNIPTPRGGEQWNAMSVMRAMKRLGIAGQMNGSPRDVTPDPPAEEKISGKLVFAIVTTPLGGGEKII
jgi:hypothetical protein